MRTLLLLVISLVGCGFDSDTTSLNGQAIARANTTLNIYIAANFQGDSGIVRLTYLNNKWENMEINLTPEKKDCSVPCDSIILIKVYYVNQNKYVNDILAYKGDSIEIGGSGIDLLYSAKTNLNRWVTLNEFDDFYSIRYPLVSQKIDSVIDLLYTKERLGPSDHYFLKERKTVGIEQKRMLYTYLNAVQNERIQEYTNVLDSLVKEKVIDTNYEQWQLFNLKMSSIPLLQQIQHELKNSQEAVAILGKFNLSEHEAVLSYFPSYKIKISNYCIQSLRRLYQPPMLKGRIPEVDYTKIYDSIPRYFENLYPEHIKFECLKQIKESGTSEKFEQYVSKFYKEVKDTSLINYVKNNLDITNTTNSDVLLSIDGKSSISLDSLIKEQNDHLVYIDFWASWCAPCIAAMPASQALKAEFEKKGVKFIYLSIDKDFSKWRVASERLGLHKNPQSFLLIDNNKAGIVENFKITTIPRYLLYDKTGTLIHPNAPGPHTEEIRLLLEKNINH